MVEFAIEMAGITKSFNNILVLDHVNLEVKTGEVHAVVGSNGAGKSTLMKILTGVYSCDQGKIKIWGEETTISDPNEARLKRIAMIFQELSLIPTLTVSENIFLDWEPKQYGIFIDDEAAIRKTGALLEKVGVRIEPTSLISELDVGYCQLVEIVKAIARDARILIMDEPTASLSESETRILFDMIRRLKAQGVAIIYISHRMNEIFQISDTITVLRNGKNIISTPCVNASIPEIIGLMIGRETEQSFGWQETGSQEPATPLLETDRLSIDSRIDNISFTLHKGEVLGLAGLMGSGRTEVLETLFGLRKKRGGRILIHGKESEIDSVEDAINGGLAMIPEDRRRQGLVLHHSVKDNLILPWLGRLKKKISIDEVKAENAASETVAQYKIVTESIHKRINLLSGGNQQKVVIAKWLETSPFILLLDEPTAGVDVGAKAEIIEFIRRFVRQGRGVIIVSSELQELLAVCHRFLILHEGKIVDELIHSDKVTVEVLQHAIQHYEA